MSFGNDPIFGIHAQALSIYSRRNEVLAANIANADTPNYKARDLDFASTLGSIQEPRVRMETTHSGHISTGRSNAGTGDLLYRIPFQPSLDGNSVESDVEQAKFGENALRYQVALRFVSGSVSKMRAAISGRIQ